MAAETKKNVDSEDGHTSEQRYDEERGSNLTRTALLRYPWYYVIQAYRQRQPGHDLFPYIHTMETQEHQVENRTMKEAKEAKRYNAREQREFEKQRKKLSSGLLMDHKDAPTVAGKREEGKKREKLVRKVLIDPGFPGWLKSLAQTDGFSFIEEMNVDYDTQEMHLVTTNDSLKSYVSIYEECSYREKPQSVTLSDEDEKGQKVSQTVQVNWTEKEQTAYMKLHTYLFGMEKSIETFGSQIFVSRAVDALTNEKKVIERLISSTINDSSSNNNKKSE